MSARATLEGWVSNVKPVGGIVFIEVINSLDLKATTVVVKRSENEELWLRSKELKLGSPVRIRGRIPERIVSKLGREVHAEEIEVLGEPIDVMPIDPSGKTKALLDTILSYRYVALRLPSQRAIFRVRAKMVSVIRRFFEENEFLEVHTPKICGAGAEGGATLFTLDYFGRQAFLAQSPQLYKQMLMAGIPRVYEITPYFRAEKFSTTRHLNESWGADAEIGFIRGPEDVMRVLENLVVYVIECLRQEAKEELRILGVDLKVPRKPFKRLSYEEAIEIAKSQGIDISYGEDLGTEAEAKIGEAMAEEGYDAYFITLYPWEIKPFYIMRAEGGLSFSFDLDYKGLELASGGQREHRYEELIKNIKDKGLNPKSFVFYTEAFKYGMPPHGGFGLGIDRLLMKVLGMGNIREVVLFPRDRQRLVP